MAEGDYRNENISSASEDEEVILQPQVRQVPIRNERGDGDIQRPRIRRKPVRIDNYTGDNVSWPVWLRSFEKASHMNGWEDDLANQLFAHLRGPAQELVCSLPYEDQDDFDSLVKALEGQFGPLKQSELYIAELRGLTKKPEESFRQLGQTVRRLTGLAYPTLAYDERDRLAKMHFVDSVPDSDIRMMIHNNEPESLDDAIKLATKMEGYRKLEQQRTGKSKLLRNVSNDVRAQDGTLERMEAMMATLCEITSAQAMKGRKKSSNNVVCWLCNQQGHIARDCVKRSKQAQGN